MPLSKILCAAIALALMPITLASSVTLAGIVSARQDAGYSGVGLSSYHLPTHGDGIELPAPSGTLKAVTIGRGIQNYTCATADDTTKPVAIGAVANLYDVSQLPQFMFDEFTACAVNADQDALDRLSLPNSGRHYFDSTGTPFFELFNDVGEIFCKRIAGIPAPAGSPSGPADGPQNGAIDWLQLADKGGSINLSDVYRVKTAGGKPPATCGGQSAQFSMQYAAQYWFFG